MILHINCIERVHLLLLCSWNIQVNPILLLHLLVHISIVHLIYLVDFSRDNVLFLKLLVHYLLSVSVHLVIIAIIHLNHLIKILHINQISDPLYQIVDLLSVVVLFLNLISNFAIILILIIMFTFILFQLKFALDLLHQSSYVYIKSQY